VDGDGYPALRGGAGAHAVSRDVLTVAGPDAVEYLQGQCSQDVAALATGDVADALLLAPDGKLVALVRVVRSADDRFLIDTAGGFGDVVAARLARFRLRSKVEIEILPWTSVAVRGPDAAGAVDGSLETGVDPIGTPGRAGNVGDLWVLPVSWNGTVGVDILGPDPAAVVPPDVRWCDDAAWEGFRVEAGIPEMGSELDDRTIAAEADLVGRTVSFTKGCYTGQELVARLDARGNRVSRRLRGIVVGEESSRSLDPSVLVGATVTAGGSDKDMGRCTSAAWCPGLGVPAALAYVHRSVPVPGPVVLTLAGDRTVGCDVRPLPLV
jgi:folate-binding protein YgfZ